MKRTIILTIALTTLLSTPCYALPEYSEETKRLMQEAGLGQEYTVDEIMARQEALKSGQTNNSTPTNQNTVKTSNRRLKGSIDEYRVASGTGQQSVQVTDTKDGLHVYSDSYANGYKSANYGSKNSYDEFHTAPYDIDANDGYEEGRFDELHINENYKQNVWHPENRGNRIAGFDEFKYADEL